MDKAGLRALTVEKMAKGLQSREGNEMAGMEGRTQLLVRLAEALDTSSEYFGQSGRPGNLLGTVIFIDILLDVRQLTNASRRLPVGSPINTGIVDAYCSITDPLERAHVRLSTHLATLSHSHQWHLPWRRLALLCHATAERIVWRP